MTSYVTCSLCGATFLGTEIDGHHHMKIKHPEVAYIYCKKED